MAFARRSLDSNHKVIGHSCNSFSFSYIPLFVNVWVYACLRLRCPKHLCYIGVNLLFRTLTARVGWYISSWYGRHARAGLTRRSACYKLIMPYSTCERTFKPSPIRPPKVWTSLWNGITRDVSTNHNCTPTQIRYANGMIPRSADTISLKAAVVFTNTRYLDVNWCWLGTITNPYMFFG
jgi:hypothetical protein